MNFKVKHGVGKGVSPQNARGTTRGCVNFTGAMAKGNRVIREKAVWDLMRMLGG